MFGKTMRMLLVAVAMIISAMVAAGCASTGSSTYSSDGQAGHSH